MPCTGLSSAGFGLSRCTEHLCAPVHDFGGALSLRFGAAVPPITEPRLPPPRTAPHAAAFVPAPANSSTPAGSASPPRAQPRIPLPPDSSHRTAARGSRPPAGSVQRGRCGAAPRRAVGWGSVGSAGLGAVACLPSPHAEGFRVLESLLGGSAQTLWSRSLFSFRHSVMFGDSAVRFSPAAEHSAGMSPSQRCFPRGFAFPGSQCGITVPCVKYGVLRAAAVIATIHISYRVLVGLCVGFWGRTAPCHRDGETPPQSGREPGDTVSVRL